MDQDRAASAIETNGLGKRFGSRWAVANLNLQVKAGEIYGFLGRNGSGKTTTIRLMLGLLRPSQGSVCIFGHDVNRRRIEAARLTGSLLEARATYDHLTGRENLDSTRRLLGLPSKEVDRVLAMVDMSGSANRKVGHYSLGMRQRLGLARALLGAPRLLVLDEPMNGLDPDGIRDMRAAIRDLPAQSGVTIFLSSHILSEVQQIATHIGLMHDGELVLQGPMSELLKQVSPELCLRTDNVPLTVQLLTADGYDAVSIGDGVRIRIGNENGEAAQINRRLVVAGIGVHELSLIQATLEALYLQVQVSRKEAA
jgi:ABC-type multidrug transport system ATPase subunit